VHGHGRKRTDHRAARGGDRERPVAGEIVGVLVLAINLRTPLHTLADVIHPFPAFNRVLGESLDQSPGKWRWSAQRTDTIHHQTTGITT
jgi:hypothetical protein